MLKDVPWHDINKWKAGWYYPMPGSSDICFEGEEINIEGADWTLFTLDPKKLGTEMEGDIIPIFSGTMDMCMDLANELNPEKLWSRPWVKNQHEFNVL